MSEIIYFDNAATTPMLPEVLDAMLPYLGTNFGNPSNIYSLGRAARWAVENARNLIAEHFNVAPKHFCFTCSATEGANSVIRGLAQSGKITRIITSPIDHHATLATAEFAQKYLGIELEYLPVDSRGYLDYAHLEGLLQKSASSTLVAILHINNEIGTILDLARLSALCREFSALLYVDAVQTVGHYPLDLRQSPVDFWVASAHKFHGPKGAGLLYMQNPAEMLPFIYGGTQEKQLRGGTENVAGIIGMAKALELAYANLAEDRRYVQTLKNTLLQGVEQEFAAQLTINGDAEHGAYSILNLGFVKTAVSDMLAINLDINGVCVSAGSACSSGAEKPSHVISGIGKEGYSALRFSFSKLNTLAEITQVLSILRSLLTA